MNLKTLPEFQKHLIRHRLGEGIIIRAIANEVNVSTNTVLLPKEMFLLSICPI
jgi:transposase